MDKTTIIALVGKGGVGKTSLSAVTVRLLAENYPDKKILAIDADPAVGLSTALGVEVTSTVDDIRKSFVQTVENGNQNAAIELLGEAKYQMFDALVENDNVSFLAIGRPESAGCYCKVNAYLKEIISMIAGNFDFVVIDGEAGIEQVNRRVMEKVTHLLLVSDASRKGLQVIKTIHDVASELVMFEKTGVIVNRMPDMSLADSLDTSGLELLACIPDDRDMALNDMKGDSVFALDENSAVVQGTKQALSKIGII
ncbi:MAG: AAA family ATPase [Eubacterium sp.]|nr:AAA family ATPase [Eubacterium sp.]MBR1531886.1 AAA family ATPase [Eubacterium sp.]